MTAVVAVKRSELFPRRRVGRPANADRPTDMVGGANHCERVRALRATAFSLMAYTANLKALQLGRDGVLTEDDIIGAWMASHGDCACGCGRSVAQNGQLDHIVPFGRGGLNTADNIQILTRSCNMRKGNQ